MSRFARFDKLKVGNEKTVTYPLRDLEGDMKLEVRPATEENRELFAALAKRIKGVAATTGRRQLAKIDVNRLAEARNEDRELYSKYVVVGWTNVVDDAGETVPFTQQNCLDFLTALPNFIFDELRVFVNDPFNFIDADPEAVEDVAKN